MPKLPVVSGKDVIKVLTHSGFRQLRQKGSHVTLYSVKIDRTVTMPLHGELKPKTLKSILDRADITLDEFLKLL
ncbi:YcfA family protein [mine drainage metagenome]|uniref:YcfA family protein n=1 Tax=mine drainage metagenome TaxID=410659 RepID=T1AGJ6_9ZZZZ